MSNGFVYDDPVVTAERLLTVHKDKAWAKDELLELVPLLLEVISSLEKDLDEKQ